MKTIAFQDIQGGILNGYFKIGEKRHERIINALKELKHTGRINVFLVDGNKQRLLFSKGY